MRRFDRSFHVGGPWADAPGIRALFSRWALPGEPSGAEGLRIGIRNGYLNLYAKGQSVAKLSVEARSLREPKIEVHPVYVHGLRKEVKPRPEGQWTRNVVVPVSEIDEAVVSKWIATASTYSSAEKRFVDDLVAANPGTLDLEMGLPATDKGGTAPRMDLVVAQDGAIAFWEAKCSNNPELRALAEYAEDDKGGYLHGIRVIHQLRKYQQWMTPSRRHEVSSAYRQAAQDLLTLADRFARPGEAARKAWRQLTETKEPELILPPGVAVGNYRPNDHPNKRWDKWKQRTGKEYLAHLADSFDEFQSTIEGHGVTVQGFAKAGVLPPLSPGEVTATQKP